MPRGQRKVRGGNTFGNFVHPLNPLDVLDGQQGISKSLSQAIPSRTVDNSGGVAEKALSVTSRHHVEHLEQLLKETLISNPFAAHCSCTDSATYPLCWSPRSLARWQSRPMTRCQHVAVTVATSTAEARSAMVHSSTLANELTSALSEMSEGRIPKRPIASRFTGADLLRSTTSGKVTPMKARPQRKLSLRRGSPDDLDDFDDDDGQHGNNPLQLPVAPSWKPQAATHGNPASASIPPFTFHGPPFGSSNPELARAAGKS